MFKEAFHYDLLLEDSVGMSYDLRDMATSYRCLNQIDSAIYYYGKANDLALALHQQRFVSMIQSQMAGLYIQLKKYDLAEIFKAEEDTKAELYKFWKEVNCYKK